MATGDHPASQPAVCVQHPEATSDYAINQLFKSRYFIVMQDERTWDGRTRGRLEEAEADW